MIKQENEIEAIQNVKPGERQEAEEEEENNSTN